MYISRIRPHDADKKRREYAQNRAHYLDSKRSEYIDWCLRSGIREEEMNAGLQQLEDMIAVWVDVANQHKVD